MLPELCHNYSLLRFTELLEIPPAGYFRIIPAVLPEFYPAVLLDYPWLCFTTSPNIRTTLPTVLPKPSPAVCFQLSFQHVLPQIVLPMPFSNFRTFLSNAPRQFSSCLSVLLTNLFPTSILFFKTCTKGSAYFVMAV
jgi:hypothetical protein